MISEIAVIVVTHPYRRRNVDKIAEAIDGQVYCVVDRQGVGASENHRRAIQAAAALTNDTRRVIIMEDDAIPVVGFTEKALAAINGHPDGILSLYLGTSRPRTWQIKVDGLLQRNPSAETITLPKLIHGVCYTMPKIMFTEVAAMMNTKRPADFAVSEVFADPGVVYCVKSLVQHADGESVESHTDGQLRNEKRVARFLASDLFF